MDSTLISIILPTHGDALFLERAVKSVQAQTYSIWELIIIDDGLTTPKKELLKKLIRADSRIRHVEHANNQGIQQSLNDGLAFAKGSFVARIDDDDEWTDREKLQKQLYFFHEHPEYVLLGTNAVIIDNKGAVLGTYRMPISDRAIRRRILSKNCFLHSTIMMRAFPAQELGGYPIVEEARHIEDYALWLQLGTRGLIANIDDNTTNLTVHASSITAQHRIAQVLHMRNLIGRYKRSYSRYALGYTLLTVRLIFFRISVVVPLPKKLLYFFQRLYKSL